MTFSNIIFSDNHFVYLEEWRQLSNEFSKNQNCLTYGCWILFPNVINTMGPFITAYDQGPVFQKGVDFGAS